MRKDKPVGQCTFVGVQFSQFTVLLFVFLRLFVANYKKPYEMVGSLFASIYFNVKNKVQKSLNQWIVLTKDRSYLQNLSFGSQPGSNHK